MLATPRTTRLLVGLLAVAAIAAPTARADSPQDKFHRAFYLENGKADLAAACKLYSDVIAARDANAELKAEAEKRLAGCQEELAAADFATLMPPNALAYVEIRQPGEQLIRLIKQLGLLADGSAPTPEDGQRVAIHPALIRELLGIRGAAIAVTGFNPFNQMPAGVAILHPGDLEVIRGLIETGLPIGGKPSKPIEGFATYDVEDKAVVTLTNRLIVVSPQRSEIANVIKRLRGEEQAALATSPQLAETLANRDDALLFFCVNAKPIMPLISGLLGAAGTQNRELALAQAVLDLQSLRTLSGKAGVSNDGLFFDLTLRLDKGHHNLVYNLFRLPPLDAKTLRCIPAGAAGFFAMSLNDADSQYTAAPTEEGAAPVVTGLDFLRETFANIIGISIFALPPAGQIEPGGPPIPDVAAVISVHDPAKSEALWTQVLGVASLAAGARVMEGETIEIDGVTVRSYALPGNVAVYFAAVDHHVFVAPSKHALGQALATKRGGKSVLDDPAFARSITRIGPASTIAVFAHPGRCFALARQYMGASEVAQAEPFVQAMSGTVASLVVDHSGELFRVSAMLTGIPNVGPLVAQMLMRQTQQRQQRQVAEKRTREVRQQVDELAREGKWDKALELVDAQLAERPRDLELLQAKLRVVGIRQQDRAAALACGRQILSAAGDDVMLLNNFAWELLTEDEWERQFAEVALELSQRSNELSDHSNWMCLDTLALAKFETGDVAGAVALEKKALEACRDPGRAHEVKQALERFESALKERAANL